MPIPGGATDPSETQVNKRIIDPFLEAIKRAVERVKWDRDHFVIPSQDTHGHSELVQVRVQPGWLRAFAALSSSGKFPFRDKGDIVRWCCWIGMHVLHHLEPEVETIEYSAELMVQIVRNRDRIIEMQKLFDATADRITYFQRKGFFRDTYSLLFELRSAIRQLPEGDAKDHYTHHFEHRFGSLLVDVDPTQYEIDNKQLTLDFLSFGDKEHH